MIKNNDVIFITSASVGYLMTQSLPADIKIRVVTNSIVIAEELRKNDNISVIMLGGEMDNKGNCYDAIAVETIKRLRFDKCFLTSACISASFGLSIQKSQAISFWNALIDSAKMTIGLYPKEKIGTPYTPVAVVLPKDLFGIAGLDYSDKQTVFGYPLFSSSKACMYMSPRISECTFLTFSDILII